MRLISTKDIETKIFQTVRFREGYDVDEVDEFLDQVIARAKADRPITPAELDAQTFQTVRFKEGYDMNEVDEFLKELANGVAVDEASPASAHSDPVESNTESNTNPSAATPARTDFTPEPHVRVSGSDPFSGGNAQMPW